MTRTLAEKTAAALYRERCRQRAAIFRTAARKIYIRKAGHSCVAVFYAARGHIFLNTEEAEQLKLDYSRTFSAVPDCWLVPADFSYMGKRAKDLRVLMLCFAAAMAETGDI